MRQSTMRRAWRVSALVGALLIGLQAGALAQDKPFAGVTLTIGTFGGAWKDLLHRNIGAELEKQGAKVQWVLGNPRDILAKLVAARGGTPPIDVIEIDDSTWKDLQARGFVQKLDHSKMPNLADVDPSNYDDPQGGPLDHRGRCHLQLREVQGTGNPGADHTQRSAPSEAQGQGIFPQHHGEHGG